MLAKKILSIGLLTTMGSAETNQFSMGDAIVWFLNVFGINTLDLMASIPTLIRLLFVLGIFYICYKKFKNG